MKSSYQLRVLVNLAVETHRCLIVLMLLHVQITVWKCIKYKNILYRHMSCYVLFYFRMKKSLKQASAHFYQCWPTLTSFFRIPQRRYISLKSVHSLFTSSAYREFWIENRLPKWFKDLCNTYFLLRYPLLCKTLTLPVTSVKYWTYEN